MTDSTTDAKNDAIVFVRAVQPRCPKCGAIRHETYRSTRRSTGTMVQHAKCRACGIRFRIVWE